MNDDLHEQDLVESNYDVEPETDDHEAVEAFAAEVVAAVEAFNVPVFTPPSTKPAPQDHPVIPGRGHFE